MNINDRKQELSQYLKTRRARLLPNEVGLPNGQRRRTPGLRREEVALLAGVGITWYTWLEQGRDIQVSDEVLMSIARALRLTDAETNHLFKLAGHTSPLIQHNGTEAMSPTLKALIDLQPYVPAIVIGRRWDILGWNNMTTAIFGDFGVVPVSDRNKLWIMFTDTGTREIIVDWEHHAQRAMAYFRLDYGQHIGDIHFEELVQRLLNHSPEFSDWWDRHDIQARGVVHKHVRHCDLGDLFFEELALQPEPTIGQRIITFVPVPDTGTLEKLQTFY